MEPDNTEPRKIGLGERIRNWTLPLGIGLAIVTFTSFGKPHDATTPKLTKCFNINGEAVGTIKTPKEKNAPATFTPSPNTQLSDVISTGVTTCFNSNGDPIGTLTLSGNTAIFTPAPELATPAH